MSLTTPWLLLALALASVSSLLGGVFLLRVRGDMILGRLGSILLLITGQVFFVACGATAFNVKMHYVQTPADLGQMLNLSRPSPPAAIIPSPLSSVLPSPVPTASINPKTPTSTASVNLEALDAAVGGQTDPAWRAEFSPSKEPGVLLAPWRAPDTGVRGEITLFKPRDYRPDDGKTYNVLVIYHGTPGSPFGVFTALDLPRRIQDAMDKGLMPPTMVVIPDLRQTGTQPDCADIPGRPPVFTWATTDLMRMMNSTFPNLSKDRRGWMLMGVSAGGWCAGRTAFLRSDLFGGAVILSAYDDPQMGALSWSSPAVAHSQALSELISHDRVRGLRLYITASTNDKDAMRVAKNLQAKAQPQDSLQVEVSQTGGHNWVYWRQEASKALTWWNTWYNPTVSPPNQPSTSPPVRRQPQKTGVPAGVDPGKQPPSLVPSTSTATPNLNAQYANPGFNLLVSKWFALALALAAMTLMVGAGWWGKTWYLAPLVGAVLGACLIAGASLFIAVNAWQENYYTIGEMFAGIQAVFWQ